MSTPKERCARWIGVGVVLLTALAAVARQLVSGASCGHDFDFHLVSWFDTLASWRQGLVYPHWSPSANYGAGEPRFVFYPPVEWMLGAALGALLPWQLVPAALTFVCLAGAGLATRALARQVLPEGAATLAGCAALLSGYSLFTAYERSDFAELTGGFWIALLLLFALRDRTPDDGVWRRALDGSTAPLALVLAGAWLSNAPLGVMASYLLAAMALAAAATRRTWAPVLRAAAATALGLGLAAVYLIPAAVEQRWADMRQILDDPASQIEASWMFARHPNPALAVHDTVLNTASLIGSGMLAVAFVDLLVCWRRGRLRVQRGWWLPLAMIPVVVLLLQFPFSGWVWNALPKLRYLQFPWRWLVTLEGPMSILLAGAVWTDRKRLRTLAAVTCAVALAVSIVVEERAFFQACDDEDAVSAMVATYRAGDGFAGTDEYEPPYADNSMMPTNLPTSCLTHSATAPLGVANEYGIYDWAADQHSCDATFEAAAGTTAEHMRIDADTPHTGYLVLKLRSYPAWAVRVNGQLQNHLVEREDGLIAVPVGQGKSHITVDWTTTKDDWAGRGLSSLALALLTGLCALEQRWKRTRLS